MTKKGKSGIKIEVACMGSFVKLYNLDKKQKDEIWNFLKFKDKNASFNPLYKKGWYDGYFRPFNRKSSIIGIGYLKHILAYLDANDWKFESKDYRTFGDKIFTEEEIEGIEWETIISPLVPRYYQREIVEECLKQKHGIIKASTSAGKTITFATLTKVLNMPTLILFKDVSLVRQSYDEFLKCGFNKRELGIVQGQTVAPSKFTFATIDSQHKLYDIVDKYKVLIIDECHGTRADGYQKFLSLVKADWRFGFSATPWNKNPSDKAKVVNYLGGMIYEKKSTKEFIEEGHLAKPIIYFVICDRGNDQNPIWTSSGANYHQLEKNEIIENEYRNNLIAKICASNSSKKIILLFQKIDHGNILFELLKNYFPNRKIDILHGEHSGDERRNIVAKFEESENNIIIASNIFKQGINIKTVEVIVNCGAGRDMIPVIQKLGRGLRIADGKTSLKFYDFMDENSRVFLRQSKERWKIYENDEGHEVKEIEL